MDSSFLIILDYHMISHYVKMTIFEMMSFQTVLLLNSPLSHANFIISPIGKHPTVPGLLNHPVNYVYQK